MVSPCPTAQTPNAHTFHTWMKVWSATNGPHWPCLLPRFRRFFAGLGHSSQICRSGSNFFKTNRYTFLSSDRLKCTSRPRICDITLARLQAEGNTQVLLDVPSLKQSSGVVLLLRIQWLLHNPRPLHRSRRRWHDHPAGLTRGWAISPSLSSSGNSLSSDASAVSNVKAAGY